MTRKFSILILLPALLLMTSCSKDDTKSPTGPGNNNPVQGMPLAVGNWWAYHTEAWMGGTEPAFEQFDTICIDTTISFDGFTWFGQKGEESFLRNDSLGVYQVTINADFPSGQRDRLYLYPASIGARWRVEADSIDCLVTSITATRSCQAGNFTGVYSIQVTGADSSIYKDYFKPGIGLICMDALTDFLGTTWGAKLECTAYHIQ